MTTAHAGTETMQALVYHGPGKPAWESHIRPAIQNAGDAVVRITTSTICGSDLHILRGDVPGVSEGRILGHEGIGVVEETGASVSSFRKGDKVVVSCITICGKCDFCRKQMYSHCRNGGWILGNLIDGTRHYRNPGHPETGGVRSYPCTPIPACTCSPRLYPKKRPSC